MNDQLINSRELARRLNVSVGTIRRWARDGVIPCVRPSRRVVRFDLADVQRAASLNHQSAETEGTTDAR